MNQYICRVCKGNECTVLTSQGPPNCGCLHNSDIGALWEQDSSYKSERDKVLEDLEKDMHEHYDFVAAQYNIQGGAYYRGRKELYEQIFEKLVELQCSKREGQG